MPKHAAARISLHDAVDAPSKRREADDAIFSAGVMPVASMTPSPAGAMPVAAQDLALSLFPAPAAHCIA